MKLFRIFLAIFLLGILTLVFFSDVTSTSAQSTNVFHLSGYAWSENIGWISFAGTTQNSQPYGVSIDDTTGQLEGYAWSNPRDDEAGTNNIGWISFNEADLTGCPQAPCRAELDLETKELKGWARVLAADGRGFEGWIHLSGVNYGVNLNVDTCRLEGFAWGETVIGWVSFSGQLYGVDAPQALCDAVGPPPVPGSFTLSGSAVCNNQSPIVNLTWTSSSDAEEYVVNKNGVFLGSPLDSTIQSFRDVQVESNTTYQYFVRAQNVSGATNSNTVSITTPNCVATSGDVEVIGDIFGTGAVKNIRIDPRSVVSSGDVIEVAGTALFAVPHYNLRGLNWNDAKAKNQALIDTLIKETAIRLDDGAGGDYTIRDFFNLNPPAGEDPRISENLNPVNPEGGVWYIAGDLIFDQPIVEFIGKGTIIVAGDVVFVSGNNKQIKYRNQNQDLLGVIILNDRDKNGVPDNPNAILQFEGYEKIVGSWYAPNHVIEFINVDAGGPPTSTNMEIQGLFIGKEARFTGQNIRLIYDGRITSQPPLGFSEIFLPSLSETLP